MSLTEAPPLPAASVSFRNLGKSGLRVSCLGLGELERRGIKGRAGILSWLPPSPHPGLICLASLLQVPGSHLVLRSQMRY